MQRFVDMSDGNLGLAILNEGLREYEAVVDDDRTLAITLSVPASLSQSLLISGVVSVTVSSIPVVQLCIDRRSNDAVPHWAELGSAPVRVGIALQSFASPAGFCVTGWRSDHSK